MRAVVVLVAFASLSALVVAPAATASEHHEFLVGYDPADRESAHLAIQAAGGNVRRHNADLGFALVSTGDPARFQLLASTAPAIDYVEANDGVGLAGAQWNGAQWNGAQWNGAQWNGAQWNDAYLKGVTEDQRLASKWTEKHFQAEVNKMRWADGLTDPGIVWQWSVWATHADNAWVAGSTGTRSATLCVLDSGVAWDHADIAPNYVAGWNARDPAASAYDDGGHGTHIAGIAAGSLADGYGIAGVANVGILNAKVLDASGAGTESDLAFGLWWCATQGADVAVMALSATESSSPTLDRAIKFAADRDVLMLASAGNVPTGVAFPASDPRVLAVSAIDGDLKLAPFSGRGPEVDLTAPGVAMLGPLPGGQFAFGSGTSQAVAYAAGVAASVRDANPALDAAAAREVLGVSARDLGLLGNDPLYGRGLVEVQGALVRAG